MKWHLFAFDEDNCKRMETRVEPDDVGNAIKEYSKIHSEFHLYAIPDWEKEKIERFQK